LCDGLSTAPLASAADSSSAPSSSAPASSASSSAPSSASSLPPSIDEASSNASKTSGCSQRPGCGDDDDGSDTVVVDTDTDTDTEDGPDFPGSYTLHYQLSCKHSCSGHCHYHYIKRACYVWPCGSVVARSKSPYTSLV
jgi:hypothetical protein